MEAVHIVHLEILSRHPQGAAHSTPLLFVHGAWHGARCWQEYFLPYFAEHGYDAYALSLRGHAGSACDRALRWIRIRDYVTDLIRAVDALPPQPVLIGHSMGGVIVQRYLEQRAAAGAVFLASVPPVGAIEPTLRVARRFPLTFLRANLTWSLYPVVATRDRARALLFSSAIPDDMLESCHRRLQDESFLAFLDMLVPGSRAERQPHVPVLVLGSDADALIRPAAVHATARVFGTEAVVLPGLGHDMMLDPGWREAADRILEWLEHQHL